MPASLKGPALLSLSSLKSLLESPRNLGCRFVLRGMPHMLLHLGMGRIVFTANRDSEVRVMPQGDSGCHSVPEQGTAGRQEAGNREGKGSREGKG